MTTAAASPPTIRLGSQGSYVAYCQNLLNKRLPGSACWVDGIFGGETDAKVKQFQGSKGLAAEGVVGPETWAALEAGPPAIKLRPVSQLSPQEKESQYQAAMKKYNAEMMKYDVAHPHGKQPVMPQRPK